LQNTATTKSKLNVGKLCDIKAIKPHDFHKINANQSQVAYYKAKLHNI